MTEYEYKWHDGSHGYIYADKCELDEDKSTYYFYRGRRQVYEMPAWMVQDIDPKPEVAVSAKKGKE